MPATDLHVVTVDQRDPRLGRQCVQDPASRGFPMRVADPSTWRTKRLRRYDPPVTPRQIRGNCTGCQKGMEGNTTGNRVARRVLGMREADAIYSLATSLDPWPGAYPPEDTGSSGLAASKAAAQLGYGGAYRWNFSRDASSIVQEIMDGRGVGVGTWWTEGGFNPKPHPRRPGEYRVEMTGPRVGGHQWWLWGYDVDLDEFDGACWWGPDFARRGNFRIARSQVADLLADDGDAVTQDMTP